ncbi:hypothetical protein P7K49_012326 [Saguinus oedipus]|uniref:Tektin n=1 Tax=Saguinus oedipus TaxID=9490 RepID=A0ABQ9VT73_SAGOE|nr:hypothetical protein P7K49_012326 [Saguinus oedipus]
MSQTDVLLTKEPAPQTVPPCELPCKVSEVARNTGAYTSSGLATSGFRTAKYLLEEWFQNCHARYHQAFADRDKSERQRHESQQLAAETQALAQRTQQDSTRRVGERLQDTHGWKSELQREVEALTAETDLLLAQKQRLERALDATEVPFSIATDNLQCRERRQHPNLVRDHVETELLKVPAAWVGQDLWAQRGGALAVHVDKPRGLREPSPLHEAELIRNIQELLKRTIMQAVSQIRFRPAWGSEWPEPSRTSDPQPPSLGSRSWSLLSRRAARDRPARSLPLEAGIGAQPAAGRVPSRALLGHTPRPYPAPPQAEPGAQGDLRDGLVGQGGGLQHRRDLRTLPQPEHRGAVSSALRLVPGEVGPNPAPALTLAVVAPPPRLGIPAGLFPQPGQEALNREGIRATVCPGDEKVSKTPSSAQRAHSCGAQSPGDRTGWGRGQPQALEGLHFAHGRQRAREHRHWRAANSRVREGDTGTGLRGVARGALESVRALQELGARAGHGGEGSWGAGQGPQPLQRLRAPFLAAPACSASTPETWAKFTQDNLCRAQRERLASANLRVLVDCILRDTSEDLRLQCDAVNLAFGRRCEELEDARHKLQHHLHEVGRPESLGRLPSSPTTLPPCHLAWALNTSLLCTPHPEGPQKQMPVLLQSA